MAEAEAGACDVVALDYLQLAAMKRGGDRRDPVDYLSAGFKNLARSREIITVLISQMRRPPSESRNRKPTMDDLKESSGIEQDADIVILLHRPEQEAGPTTLIETCIAKNRNGEAGIFQSLLFKGENMTFALPVGLAEMPMRKRGKPRKERDSPYDK